MRVTANVAPNRVCFVGAQTEKKSISTCVPEYDRRRVTSHFEGWMDFAASVATSLPTALPLVNCACLQHEIIETVHVVNE